MEVKVNVKYNTKKVIINAIEVFFATTNQSSARISSNRNLMLRATILWKV